MVKEKRAIAMYFAQQLLCQVTVKTVTRHLPSTVDKWGKIQILSESEGVRSIYG